MTNDKQFKNSIELLAPAGNKEAFIAAVENGADAVYLGGQHFNARQFAGNFDRDTLKWAIDYAHVRDVKVYLTMNTLILESEIEEALKAVEEAFLDGIDAIIVQDLGFATLLRKIIPNLPLHGSTQMTVTSPEGAKILEDLGLTRVVTARELSLSEIENISKSTSMEVEVFSHGALCISYSGQCLMSSMIGGRSGNRGSCAQPCRMRYEMLWDGKEGNSSENKIAINNMGNEEIKNQSHVYSSHKNLKTSHNANKLNDENIVDQGYLLSPKDLATIDILGDMINAGVTSFKIEGRMKSPQYVAIVTSIYRKYLDITLNCVGAKDYLKESQTSTNFKNIEVDEKDREKLAQIFNRGGFTKNYLEGKRGRNMMSIEKPKNWGLPAGEALLYDKVKRLVKVKLTRDLNMGDGIEFWTDSDEHPGNLVTRMIPLSEGENSVINASNYQKNNKQNIQTQNTHNSQEALSKNSNLSQKPSLRTLKAGSTAWIGYIESYVPKGSKLYKTSDKLLNEEAERTYAENVNTVRKGCIHGKISLRLGLPAIFEVWDNNYKKVSVKGNMPVEKAISRPMDEERLKEQLKKTGSTPFVFETLEVELDEGINLPISELNNIRREALERLEVEKKRIGRSKKDIKGLNEIENESVQKKEETELRIKEKNQVVNKPTDLRNSQINIDTSVMLYKPSNYLFDNEIIDLFKNIRIYLPSFELKSIDKKAIERLKENNNRIFLWTGSPSSVAYKRTMKIINEDINSGNKLFDGILASNLGHVLNLTQDYKVIGDIGLNLYNSLTQKALINIGLIGSTISPELPISQIKELDLTRELNLSQEFITEAIVYGKIPVMTSAYCPVSSIKSSGKKISKDKESSLTGKCYSESCNNRCSTGTYCLKDRKAAEFPIISNTFDCTSIILNSKSILMTDSFNKLKEAGVSSFRYCFYDEPAKSINDLLEASKK